MRDSFLNSLSRVCSPKWVAPFINSRTLRIVCFHSVTDAHSFLPRHLYIRPENFIAQLKMIQQCFNVITFEDLQEHNLEEIRNPLILTFDDGLRDNFDMIFLILKKMRLRGVFYINTLPLLENRMLWTHNMYLLNTILGTRRLHGYLRKVDSGQDYMSLSMMIEFIKTHLSYEEIEESFDDMNKENGIHNDGRYYVRQEELQKMVAGGMEIGSHGYSHFVMSKLKDLHREGEGSRDYLEMLIGLSVKSFAYPFGNPTCFNQWSHQYFRRIFDRVCTTIPGINRNHDDFVLHRVCSYEMPPEKLFIKLLMGY